GQTALGDGLRAERSGLLPHVRPHGRHLRDRHEHARRTRLGNAAPPPGRSGGLHPAPAREVRRALRRGRGADRLPLPLGPLDVPRLARLLALGVPGARARGGVRDRRGGHARRPARPPPPAGPSPPAPPPGYLLPPPGALVAP